MLTDVGSELSYGEKVKECWDKNFSAWQEASENGFDVWRDHVNTPAFLRMLPDLTGLSGLDIGCGDGHNTRLIAERCAKLVGVDFLEKFIEHNKNLPNPPHLDFRVADAIALPFDDNSMDFVVSTMTFMNMAEIDKGMAEAYRLLKPGGFLQFSITHPCFNERKGKWTRNDRDEPVAFTIENYFSEINGEVHRWKHYYAPENLTPFDVPRFLRPLSRWLNIVTNAGFLIEQADEPYADDESIAKYPALLSTRVVAHSLILRARK